MAPIVLAGLRLTVGRCLSVCGSVAVARDERAHNGEIGADDHSAQRVGC